MGLPVPLAEASAGICKQVGNFVTMQMSTISCTAMDKSGKEIRVAIRIRRRADGGASHQADAGRKPRGVAV